MSDVPAPTKGEKILVVEDSKINQTVVLSMLGKLALGADLAENGREAVEKIKRQDFALVLMDCQMPEMDGYEATRLIRELEAAHAEGAVHTPIIAMTAHAMPGDREKCIDAGMDDYMAKPIKLADLRGMIAKWVVKGSVERDFATGPREQELQDPSASAAGLVEDSVIQGLLSLQKPGKPSLLAELIDLFLVQAPERIAVIEKAHAAGDVKSFERAAHSLKGSSGILGAMPMMQVCETLQNQGRAGDIRAAAPLIQELKQLWERTRLALVQRRPDK